MSVMFDKFVGKRFFFISLSVAIYFCFFILDWYIYKWYEDITTIKILIGILRELTMMPLLFIIQPGLFIFSIIHCINEKFRIRSWSFLSFLILLFSNLFCLGSFFFRI